MKRFKSILCASLLTLALSPAALAGNITTRDGNITTISITDICVTLVTAIIG